MAPRSQNSELLDPRAWVCKDPPQVSLGGFAAGGLLLLVLLVTQADQDKAGPCQRWPAFRRQRAGRIERPPEDNLDYWRKVKIKAGQQYRVARIPA